MPKKGSPTPAAEPALEPIRPPNIWISGNARTLVAIDPGDVHVGVAEFTEHEDSWECVRAYELGWTEGADYVAGLLANGPVPTILVLENFKLRADLATAQIGSEMETCQLIGVIKYLHGCYDRRRKNAGTFEAVAQGWRPCELVLQEPSIQKATDRILNAKGVPSEANGNDHARSAELHGWHRILRENVR